MLRYFPNEYVEDVYSIDYQGLYDAGFRGLVFDIDNTLVAHGTDSTPEVDSLFELLHNLGFKTLLLTNNSEERVRRFIRNIDTFYIPEAGKPARHAFYRALEMLDTTADTTVMIGDTTHTDILGANKAGLKSILVKYIGYYNNEPKGIRRTIERIMMSFYPLIANKRTILKKTK